MKFVSTSQDPARSPQGSVWRRWDLHLHAPGTKLSNGFGDSDEVTLKAFVEQLEASDVQVFGITDYFSFDSYFAVKQAYEASYPETCVRAATIEVSDQIVQLIPRGPGCREPSQASRPCGFHPLRKG